MRKVPKIIEEVGFDFHWDNKKVWALNYPIEEIDINELSWHFDTPFWNTATGFYDLKPSDVIRHSEKFKEEHARVLKADTNHPIDIMHNKGKWLILDGLHRLVKLKLQGAKKVKVRKIPRDDIPKITQ